MQTLMLRPLRASLSLVLFPLAMLASSASLLACSGDDTNPPAPPSDAGSDASKPADGSVDSSTPADAADSGSAGDAADASG
jgi:hypothetical protein